MVRSLVLGMAKARKKCKIDPVSHLNQKKFVISECENLNNCRKPFFILLKAFSNTTLYV